VDSFAMNTADVENAAKQITNLVPEILRTMASAPGAAASAASANTGYLTSQALVQLIATELLEAVQRLSEQADDHAKLLEESRTLAQERDAAEAKVLQELNPSRLGR
jgi:hypothetical protein